MGQRDLDYYRRRIAEESLAARGAPSDLVRDLHLDLASRYREKLRLVEALSRDASFSEPRHPALVRPPGLC